MITDARLKSDLKHECDLIPDENIVVSLITSGLFVSVRRKCKLIMTISSKYPQSSKYFCSTRKLLAERERHLLNHYHMIHPFSEFRLFWEIFMALIYFIYFNVIIFIVLYAENKPLMILQNVLDVIWGIDIILNFNTGYLYNSKVELSRKQATKHYLMTWFPFDFISSVNFRLVMADLPCDYQVIYYLVFLRMFRIFTMMKYLDSLRGYLEIPRLTHNFFKLMLTAYMVALFINNLIYMLTQVEEEKGSFKHWLHCFHHMLLFIFHFGPEENEYKTLSSRHLMGEILLLIYGLIIKLVCIIEILMAFSMYTSSASKFHEKIKQIEMFMRYRGLPSKLWKRIITMVDFRFNQNFYNESTIYKMLSPALKQEMLLTTFMPLIGNVDFFNDIPLQIISCIVAQMKIEIYLPSDIVVSAGAIGDTMYIIANGTVAIYTTTGKEICHLSEGAAFGEISLIFENERRVATVVAIDCCEMYVLHRKDFLREIEHFPEYYNKMTKGVQDKLRRLLLSRASEENLSMDSVGSHFSATRGREES